MPFLKIFLPFILTLAMVSPTQAAEKWTITSLDWEPYSGKKLPDHGKSIVKLRQALQLNGIILEVNFLPWARAKAMATQPGYVGYFPAWPEEVNEGFIASPPVDWSEIAIMSLGERTIPADLDSLFSTHIVGLIRSYTYPKEIEEAASRHKNNVDEAPDENSLVRKLARGRCDVAITDPAVMKYYAEQNNIEDIVALKHICKIPLVLAIKNSAQSKRVLEILTNALARQIEPK
ncbi:transporter substrate-binding domain-containing protein [Desulfovibrio sp. JC022]|uniref:transporter substrate-binding domain-containing protein n=1 Tax=Desulfovibrio sp. JC022 TaxID=2593642 RepID=UPI0013D72D7C|nr:transporter substrate-binding domain-containing protein [Desulfovibrio sp. JC022]NDV24627.1 amino acid ABC transporter substrate-binding protein [Desulfovibrio sp. JC022]